MKTNVLYGVLGGLLLHVLFVFQSYVPYMPVVSDIEIFLHVLCVLVGGMIVLLTIIWKNRLYKAAFVRTICLFLGLVVLVYVYAESGLMNWVDRTFHIVVNESKGLAAGLAMAFTMVAMFISCVIANIIVAIKQYRSDEL